MKTVCCSVILAFAVWGCGVRQPFEFQDVRPAAAGTVKLSLSVAVFEDPSLEFDYPPIASLRSFTEVMNPGLSETVYNAFGPDFQRIKVVHALKEAADFDLLALPTLEPSDPVTVTIRFVEPLSGRLVTQLSSVHGYDGHARDIYSHLIADLFLFATAVAIPPSEPFMVHAIQRHTGQRFNAMFAPAVAQTVGDIAAQTTKDPGLVAMSHVKDLSAMAKVP